MRGASGKAGVPGFIFLSSLVCVSAAGKAGAEGSVCYLTVPKCPIKTTKTFIPVHGELGLS